MDSTSESDSQKDHASTNAKASRLRATAYAACLVVLGITTYAVMVVRNAREVGRDGDCVSQLKQIGLALKNYHDMFQCFPPASTVGPDGKPLHSWRALCMSTWPDGPIDGKYDVSHPWNRSPNSDLSNFDTSGFFYWCPSGNGRTTKETDYVAVTGPQTAWPDGGCLALSDMGDSPSETILVVEVPGSGIHWMEPRDLTLDGFLGRNRVSRHRGHFNALFADGSVRKVSTSLHPRTLTSLLTANGGESIDIESISHSPTDGQAP